MHALSAKSIFMTSKQLKLETFQKPLLVVPCQTAVIQWRVAGRRFEQDVHLQTGLSALVASFLLYSPSPMWFFVVMLILPWEVKCFLPEVKKKNKNILVSGACEQKVFSCNITVDLRSVVFIFSNITNTAVSLFYLYQSALFLFWWFTWSRAPVDKWLEHHTSEMFPLNKQLRENLCCNKTLLFLHVTVPSSLTNSSADSWLFSCHWWEVTHVCNIW